MSLDSNKRPGRSRSGQGLWPKWMWVAIPLLVIIVVAGLWWAIFAPSEPSTPTPTPTPTMKPIAPQPTQAPTLQETLPPGEPSPTYQVLPPLPTFTPTPLVVMTPTGEAVVEGALGLGIGDKVKVTGTGNVGLNMRAGAGTGHARVKTLPEGSVVEVIGGPTEANEFTWWQVRDQTGATGWVAGKFLKEQ